MTQAPDVDRSSAAQARTRHAGNLLNTGRFAEALAEYDWLWRHLQHEAPSMVGVRLSFMAAEMGQLCRRFPPAQAHFEQLRDLTEANAGPGTDEASIETRLDWMVLNEIVGEADRTLLWWDGVDVAALSDEQVRRCIPRVVPLLRRRGRWAEIGRLFRDPMTELLQNHDMVVQADAHLAHQPASVRQRSDEMMKDMFREQTSVIYRGLSAAGRTDLATALQQEAVRLDPSPEMREALATTAPIPAPGPRN